MTVKRTIPKIKSIAPLTPDMKRANPSAYDALHNLDKRVSEKIDTSVRASITEAIFLGYFTDGGYAGVQGQSDKFKGFDGYQYQQRQVKYQWSLYSTRTAAALNPDGTPFVNGQLKRPARESSNSGAGEIYWMDFDVNQDDGGVTTLVSYYVPGGTETVTNDGVLAVVAICQRSVSP